MAGGRIAAPQPRAGFCLPRSSAWVSSACVKETPVPAWEDVAKPGPCSGCSLPGGAWGCTRTPVPFPLRLPLPRGSVGSGWR